MHHSGYPVAKETCMLRVISGSVVAKATRMAAWEPLVQNAVCIVLVPSMNCAECAFLNGETRRCKIDFHSDGSSTHPQNDSTPWQRVQMGCHKTASKLSLQAVMEEDLEYSTLLPTGEVQHCGLAVSMAQSQ